jgi:hypothetical protein
LTIARRASGITKLQLKVNGPPIVRRLHDTGSEPRNDWIVEELGE